MASGEADSVNLKYTDSGKIKAILVSPKMLDYATVLYPFTEFPNGIAIPKKLRTASTFSLPKSQCLI